MPERLRTPNWVIDLVTALWVQAAHRRMASGSLVDQPAAPISEELEEKWQELLGSEMPRIRKVQEVIAETKQRFNLFLHRDTVEPLGAGWPRSPHDVFYLMKLDKLAINEGIDPSAVDWTNDEIEVALELREILEPHFQVDKTPSTTGLLQHPYLGVDIPAELAIIKELTIRRRLEREEALPGGQVDYRDLYSLLLERGTNESFQKDKGIRFSRKKWSPILHEASGRRAVDVVTSALENLHSSAENYRTTANLEDQKWGLPDYPGQSWIEWLKVHDYIDYPGSGFQDVQDDYEEKLAEDLQQFVGGYLDTLETLEEFAPVSRIETSHLKCGVMSSIGTSLPEYQKRSFIRDSPLSSTWNMCLSAKVLADSIMSHYLDLNETEMVHLVDNRRFGEPFDDVSNNFEFCLLNLREEDMMEVISEMKREDFLFLGFHPLRSGHVESSTNRANPEQIQDYFEAWCPVCNQWLWDTYQ